MFIDSREERRKRGGRRRGTERESKRERKRIIDVREKHRSVAKPTTWVCALTRDQTHHPLAYGTMPQPTELLIKVQYSKNIYKNYKHLYT